MLTVGVDLAAEPTRTGFASIEWAARGATLVELEVGILDSRIIELSSGATVVGIDTPFGWPIEFAEFVAAHQRHEVAPREFAGKQWRQRIRFRETDRHTRDRIGRWPLSVATDLLSLAAMHGAELIEAFEGAGVAVDRSGGGVLAEVYPAAALRLWQVDVAGYKRDAASLATAAERVLARVPWLAVRPEQVELMSRSDDALDALVAALIARAHALGMTEPVPPEHLHAARIEGWIILPTGALSQLVD